MIRSSNPTLGDKVFSDAAMTHPQAESMSISGTVNKTGILLTILIICASFTWSASLKELPSADFQATFVPTPWLWIGAIGGFIMAIITIFKKTWAPFTTPIYAALEGLFLGALSAGFEVMYPGIVFQAVILTFGTLFALLGAYKSGMIAATENFKLGIAAATGGIALVYLVGFIMSFFGSGIPYIHESGLIGIGFSLFVVVIAALNLVIDFDFIENGEANRAPKYMEWYAAFGLLVTLIWLYVEFLRLLSKLQSRD